MNADRKRETLMTKDTTADGARTLAKKAETVENGVLPVKRTVNN